MSKISSTKVNLKDKINDGEIDLSLCELQDVPVKEIAAVRNIYSLDLSTNHLIKLPNNFVTLTHLTKLDLSKNSLRSLPEDFGNLVKLKYLDLYKNEIEYLPLSFHKLKALRWLDLKDNPLTPSIKAITGPCLDAAECQKCAVEIVKFFTEFTDSLNVELKKRDEQRQQSKLAKEQAEQKQRIQEKKKKKKEKKARSNEVADATSVLSNNSDGGLDRNSNETAVQVKTKRTSCLRRFLGVLFSVVFLFSLVFICSTFKHDVIERFVNNVGHVWKLCIKNLPPEAQKLANAFGEQIYKCHECTKEIVRNVARGVADAITNSDVFFDHVVYYKNQLYEKINYFYTKYVL